MNEKDSVVIGFIGGTGPEGRGLALRFALAGEQVLLGSRNEARARDAVDSILALAPRASVSAALNLETARQADIVFVTVPYAGHRQTLESVRDQLAGKIVVDVVAPVAVANGVAEPIDVPEGSAALEAQTVLPNSAVVGAFQTISAKDLLVPDKPIDSDVVVCADDPKARETVMSLAEQVSGVRAVNGGGLHNAGHLERLTALLMNINRLYKAHTAIKIVGI